MVEKGKTNGDTPPPPTASRPPDEIELLDGDRFMFKQDGSLFKQVLDGQKVVGLLYKKQRGNGDWTTLGYAQVKSRSDIYQRRAKGEGTEAARQGAVGWAWALSLFSSPNN